MSSFLDRWWNYFRSYNPDAELIYSPYWGNRNPAPSRRRPAPKPPKPEKPKEGQVLNIKSVDLVKDHNRRYHKTDAYEKKNLIVRRGRRIELKVQFERAYDDSKDDISFQMEFGADPRPSKGTMHCMKPMKFDLDPTKWEVRRIGKPDGKTEMRYRMMASIDAPVGKWKLIVKTCNKETKETEEFEVDEMIYILFNPWCYADQVFLGKDEDDSDDGWVSDSDSEDDDASDPESDDPEGEERGPPKKPPKAAGGKLKEYILKDTGRVWRGSYRRFHAKAWSFAQFEDPCLDAAIHLLDISGMREGARGNATLVCRKLSQMANSNDDDGVLSGRWSKPYTGGTKPTAWNGSQPILEQYMRTKKDVKYGQCWVFSCLLTTLGRALGIPTRTVTNFASAHDTDFSMTIDKHVDEEGERIPGYDDSIWNFHVWNEAWLHRPDLPEGYDGWQAFDSTPQELSEGVMQCGPAPVKAIKNGDVYVGYDAKFIYGEVNGDVITWILNNQLEMLGTQKVDQNKVGKNISTKSVKGSGRKDITNLYKHPEGSEEEREANAKAMMHSTRKHLLDDLPDEGDVHFRFDADESRDGDMTAHVFAKNTSEETRTVKLKISINAKYYTGQAGDDIKFEEDELVLGPGEEKEHVTTIGIAEYMSKMEADAAVNFYFRAKVAETEQRYVSEDLSVHVEKPDIELTPSNKRPQLEESFKVDIKFQNPLNIAMTNLTLVIEAPGITKCQKVPIPSSLGRRLEAQQTLETSIDLKGHKLGRHEIIASLTSNQIADIDGVCKVRVIK